MAVNKIDPKVIFASEAPSQDVPAVFTNKTVGWGESRKNGGRPTIKQANALQQETDLKILWLNENSVSPFDATIDYPVNAVTIKDGAFKIFNGSVWNLFLNRASVGLSNVNDTSDANKPISTATAAALDLKADKSATYTKSEVNAAIAGATGGPYLAAEVLDGNQTQDQINLFGGKKYDMSAGSYPLNARVLLNNGNIVKSTIPSNTNNPNTNMTGWVNENSASQIFDESGESQQEINDAQAERNKDNINAKDWGVLPTNDAATNYANMFALLNAYPERDSLDIFVPIGTYSFSQGFFITRPHKIRGVGVGELSKTVFDFNGAVTVGTVNYKASIFIVHSQTIEDTSGYGASLPVDQVGISGTGACVDYIKVINSSDHGIIKNAPSYLKGIAAMNCGKHGIFTVANTGAALPRISGIANQGSNTECAALFNEWSGIVESGDDANVIKNDSCLAAYNTKFGFYDASLLGGTNINGQSHENTLGDYCMQGSLYDDSGNPETPARTVFVSTYAENARPQAYSMNSRSLVVGYTGAEPYSHNINVLSSTIEGLRTTKAMSVTEGIQWVNAGKGGDFVSIKNNSIDMGFTANPDASFSITNLNDPQKVMALVNGYNVLSFFLQDLSATLRQNRPWFPNGLTMGSRHHQSVGSAPPDTGAWEIGNIMWNESPVTGGFVGWVLTPEGWKGFGLIQS